MKAELLGCGLTVEGQLGVRLNEPNIVVPERIIGAPNDIDGTSVKQVACGENHTLFLTKDGKIWSVGGNTDGQLGRGGSCEGSFSIYPVASSQGVEFIQIAAGRAHCIAVAEDGRVFTWGSNEHGQLGLTSLIQRQETPKRVKTLNEVIQIAAGSDHSIALTESGRVFVWGEQADGRCIHEPILVEELSAIPIVRVVAGSRHCIAISASGSVYSWGQNDHGQLGFDDPRPRTRAFHIEQMDGFGVVEAACGDAHTVLLTTNGRLFSFGSDSLGQCGFERKTEKRTSPTAISDLIGSHVTRVAAGRCHTLAIVSGFVYPFGLNSSGQLGNGSVRTQGSPRRTDELDHVTSVFAGWDQSFFLRSAKLEVNQEVGPCSQVKYPQKLTRENLEAALKSGDKLNVIALIESVFSSASCINNSFLYPDDRRFCVGFDRSHGIDMDQVMEAFLLLDECSSRQQYYELIAEMLAMSLESTSSYIPSVERLRLYLILPWLTVFSENVNENTVKRFHLPLFKHLCQNTNEKLGNVLERWWSEMSARHFRRIVVVAKAAVRCFVAAKKKPFECQEFLHVLNRLHTINKKYHIVPLEIFYVDELNDNFDVKLDYVEWVAGKQQQDDDTSPFNHWSNWSFLLNAAAKGNLLHVDALWKQHVRVQNSQVNTIFGSFYKEIPVLEIHVRRDFIVSDTMNRMAHLDTSDLQKPLKVKIQGEEADDAGGVRKEFFMIVMPKVLQPEYGMFVEDETSHLVWFSGLPEIICDREQFRQLGRLVGLAIYNQILVPFPFPLALYKLLLEQSPSLEDLIELSPIEGNGLQSLLDYEGDDIEDVFCLNFTISFNCLGESKSVELCKGGEGKNVNKENRQAYVDLYVKHRLSLGLNGEIAQQARLFCAGFRDSLNSRILSFFQPRELMELVVGNENYDWSQFRECVEYKDDYNEHHPAIIAFWKAFYQLTDEQKKKFLQFLSGSTRLPVAGMSALQVTIQPSADTSLPVAHTCFNLLDLPNISDADELLRRLLISIEHTEEMKKLLVIIKPEIVAHQILKKAAINELKQKGIEIEEMRMMRIGRNLAEKLYQQHKDKFFYNRLVRHITSGEVLALRVIGNPRDCIGSSRLCS
ncbi:unnamed protein product [Caenorhabditis angaria]|uniref:HECT domain-containing protein n=1 Tax=Caenorhabditis angaria TaxID=860376 RepID=A0A9P1I3C0_9PELO|nr:unnamed protein product [Caenorhabditis angaria]